MASLVGTVSLTNSFGDGSVLSTADDGQIALISESGVHTLLYNASPLHQQQTFHIQIAKIDAVSDVFIPVSDFNSKGRSKFDVPPEFMLDHTLNVVISCNSGAKKSDLNESEIADKSKKADFETSKTKTEQRGARQARWSPRNADVVGSCLLAVVWFDHRLIVYGDFKRDRLWHGIADISELWKAEAIHWLSRPQRKPRTADKETKLSSHLEKLRDDCYTRAAVAIAWSSLYEHVEFDEPEEPPSKQSSTDNVVGSSCDRLCVLLAVAMKSGDIVLWKVELPAESERDFHVVRIVDFGCSLPRELLFIPVSESLAYLCQGNKNGTVVLHPIRLKKNGHLTDQMSDQPLEIWSDVDKMSVSGLTWSSNRNILLATKGQTILIWHLDLLDTGQPVVSFVKSPAVSFDYSVFDAQLRINKIFLSDVDGQIYQTSLDDLNNMHCSDAFLPLQLTDVPWNSRDWRINGLALSPNGIFLITTISPASYFCHLTLRKPSKIRSPTPIEVLSYTVGLTVHAGAQRVVQKGQILPKHGSLYYYDASEIQWLCIKSVEEISNIVLNHKGSLYELNDALAYLKWDWSTRHQWTDNIMQLLGNQDSWSTYSTYRLKLLRLLLQIQIMYWKEDLDKTGKVALEENLSTVEEMIIQKHVQHLLDQFSDLDAKSSLTVNESRLLAVMVNLLKQESPSADDSNRVKRIPKKFHLTSELCSICESEIPFVSFRKANCERGHTFSRCCQTLLLCQKIPYRVCSFCKALALPKDSNDYFGLARFTLQSNECTYCDGRLI